LHAEPERCVACGPAREGDPRPSNSGPDFYGFAGAATTRSPKAL
jgi:hypothetical protein